MTAQQISSVDAFTLKEWLDQDKAVLIDVREPMEYSSGHIPGSQSLPLSQLEQTGLPTDPDKMGVFYCATGRRTAMAGQYLVNSDFNNVYHLLGGISAWKMAGLITT